MIFLDYSDSEFSRDRSLFYNSQHLNLSGAEQFSEALAMDLARVLRKGEVAAEVSLTTSAAAHVQQRHDSPFPEGPTWHGGRIHYSSSTTDLTNLLAATLNATLSHAGTANR